MSSVKDEAGQSVVYLCSACQFLCEDLEAVENHRCPGKVVSDTEGGSADLDGSEDVSAVGEGLVAIEQAGVSLEDIALQAAQEALDQDQDQDEIPLRRPGEVGGVQTVVWGPIRTRVLIEAVHAFAQSEDPKSTFFWNLVANRVNENLGDGTEFSHLQCQRRWRRLAFTYREAKEKNRLYKFMYGEELAPILETKKPGLFSPKRFVSKTKRVHPATMYRYNFVWDKESLERMVNIYKSEKTLLDVGSCDESQFFKHIAEVLSLDVGEKISGPIVRNKWKKLRSDFREATGQHWTEKDPKFFEELIQFLRRDDADITLTLANTEEFSDSESSDVETVGSTINEWTQRLLLALIRSYAQELANGRDGDSDDIFRNISETLVNEFQIRVNYPLLRDQFLKLEEYYRTHDTAEISDKNRQAFVEGMEQFFSKLFTENVDFLQKNPLQLVVKTSLGKAKRIDEDKLVKWDRKSTLMLVRLARAHMYILKRGTAVLLFRKVAALMSERGYLMNGHQALGRWKNLARKYHAKATKTNFARLCDFYETKLNGVDEVIEELEDMPVTFSVPSESRPLNSASNSKVVSKSAKRPRRDSNEMEDPDLNNASDPEWTLPETPKPSANASKKIVHARRPASPVAVITISKTAEPAGKKSQASGFVLEEGTAGKQVSENGEACRLCGRWDEVLAQIMDDEREARKAELATIKKAVQENTQAIQKLATVLDSLSTALKAVSAKPEVNNLLLEAMVEAEDQYLAEEQNSADNAKAEEFVTEDFSRQLEPTEGNSKDNSENNHKSCPVYTIPSEELFHKSICPHISPSSCVTLRLNPHFASCFVKELKISPRYRSSVFSTAWSVKLQNPSPTLVIKLRSPKSEYLDRNWCGKVQRLLYERLELEHLFSWLSTLGGAYSSLGDNFTPCAELAGKISLQQMKIGLRLGDPHLVARCYLYLALSFIQKHRLRKAAAVIRWVYSFAKASALEDKRLCNMCLGMWARLQYTWSQERCTRVDKRG